MTTPDAVDAPYLAARGDRDSAPYWEGIASGRLLLQRCGECETYRWPFRSTCQRCGSAMCNVVAASTRGVLHSWCVTHHPFQSSLSGVVPYTNVLVQLEEQFDLIVPGLLSSRDSPDQLAIGCAMVATFETNSGDVEWCCDT